MKLPIERDPAAQPSLLESSEAVLRDTLKDLAKPFKAPEDSPATPWTRETASDTAVRITKGINDLASAPQRIIEAAAAALLRPVSVSSPAATFTSATLAIPHTHAHPPACPAPLLGLGVVSIGGCLSVLICGLPAARAGDAGFALSCGTTSPLFDIVSGSSSVFIGGARAARMHDFVRQCTPKKPKGAPPPLPAAVSTITEAVDLGPAARKWTKKGLVMAGLLQSAAREERAREEALTRREAGDHAAADAAERSADSLHLAVQSQAMQLAVDSLKDTFKPALERVITAAVGADPATSPCVGMITFSPTLVAPRKVYIGGFPLPPWDLVPAAARALRVRAPSLARSLRDRLHRRLRPGRHENAALPANVVKTGDPIDVVTGRVLVHDRDAYLPGPLPIVVERAYSSAWGPRDSPLGRGWSLSLDQALWPEPHQIVLRDADGRELAFPLPAGELDPAATYRHHDPRERLTLRRLGDGRWDILEADGARRIFAPIPGDRDPTPGLCRLVERLAPGGERRLRFDYDPRARLIAVTADGGRGLRLRWDRRDRLIGLDLPDPDRDGAFVPHRAYVIDDDDDLASVTDALGGVVAMTYENHRLVRRQRPCGLTFTYAYDGWDHHARCVHAVGDGGLLERTLAYDKTTATTVVVDAEGAATIYRADERGRVVAITDPLGHTTALAYDDHDRLVAVTDPLGHTTARDHDALGRVTCQRDPAGTALTYRYSVHDAPIAATDPVGGLWAWRRDDAGRLLEAQDPLGRITRHTYQDGLVRAIVDPTGARTELAHDAHGDLLRARLPGGAALAWSYDRRGRLRSAIDARGNPRHFYYDLEDRLLRVDEPDGNTRAFEYDLAGRLLRARDRLRDVELTWAGPGWLVARAEAGRVTTLTRDREGRVTAITCPDGHVNRFELDPVGRPLAVIEPAGARRRLAHDPAGRLVRVVDPSGAVTRYAHDPAGRLVAVDHDDGGGLRLELRADGHLVRLTRLAPGGAATVVELERDLLGQILREHQGDAWVAYDYDLAGRRLALRSSLGAHIRLEHDPSGGLIALHADLASGPPHPLDLRVERDRAGLELRRLLPGGAVASWRRDALGRPIELRVEGPPPAIPGLRPTLILQRRARWSHDQRLLAIDDLAHGPVELRYDPSGALERAEHLHAGVVYRRAHVTQDPRGEAAPPAPPPGAPPSPDSAEAVSASPAPDPLAFDRDGRRLTRRAPDGLWRYTWDAAGLLIGAESPHGDRYTMTYDALGRRVSLRGPRGETRWIWDGDVPLHTWTTPLETAPTPPEAPPAGLVTWIFEPGTFTPLARLDPRERLAVIADHRGVPIALLDDAGRARWRAELTPDGALCHLEGPRDLCPFRLPGHHDDPELDLTYNRFRYLDPADGRFLSPDPLGLAGGLNPYAPVECPFGQADPLGLRGETLGAFVTHDDLIAAAASSPRPDRVLPGLIIPKDLRSPSSPAALPPALGPAPAAPRPAHPVVVDAAARQHLAPPPLPIAPAPPPLPRPRDPAHPS